MDLTNAFLRAIDDRGDVYLPYTLEGAFTESERKVIEDAIAPHVPSRVSATFNNWHITKSGRYFDAKRATWDRGIATNTAQEMADRISEYYSR